MRKRDRLREGNAERRERWIEGERKKALSFHVTFFIFFTCFVVFYFNNKSSATCLLLGGHIQIKLGNPVPDLPCVSTMDLHVVALKSRSNAPYLSNLWTNQDRLNLIRRSRAHETFFFVSLWDLHMGPITYRSIPPCYKCTPFMFIFFIISFFLLFLLLFFPFVFINWLINLTKKNNIKNKCLNSLNGKPILFDIKLINHLISIHLHI